MLQRRLYLLVHHTPISITLQSPFVYFLMQSTTASYCELCFLIFILYQLTFRHINLQKNALLLNPDFFMFQTETPLQCTDVVRFGHICQSWAGLNKEDIFHASIILLPLQKLLPSRQKWTDQYVCRSITMGDDERQMLLPRSRRLDMSSSAPRQGQGYQSLGVSPGGYSWHRLVTWN